MPHIDNGKRHLAEAMTSHVVKPLRLGLHDCAHLLLDRSLLTAVEDVWRPGSGATLQHCAWQRARIAVLGWPRWKTWARTARCARRDTLLAQRGDIVLADTGLGFCVWIGPQRLGISRGAFFAA